MFPQMIDCSLLTCVQGFRVRPFDVLVHIGFRQNGLSNWRYVVVFEAFRVDLPEENAIVRNEC